MRLFDFQVKWLRLFYQLGLPASHELQGGIRQVSSYRLICLNFLIPLDHKGFQKRSGLNEITISAGSAHPTEDS
ncbi:hypothetical protein T10_7575 [Trichinella papuae]|uniref:Uncharacterized protein n=1 Tax=Trichinella papuae TaxID=268474 RepID=A0A0V1M1G4_9BILA|nr:hypothetical protein T10_2574 [Trichinella papuae]KRZ65871.1 hypothetical protein T10_7575 [Trichinella papuae]